MEANFSVPQPDKEKLLGERAEATARAFADEAPAPSPAPAIDAGAVLASATPAQLQAAGEAWPGLTEKETQGLLVGVFSPILEWGGKPGLSAQEIERGGVALTPSLNKWLPWALKHHAQDLIALAWVLTVVKARKKKSPKTVAEARALLLELEAEGRPIPKNADEARKLLAELEARERQGAAA